MRRNRQAAFDSREMANLSWNSHETYRWKASVIHFEVFCQSEIKFLFT